MSKKEDYILEKPLYPCEGLKKYYQLYQWRQVAAAVFTTDIFQESDVSRSSQDISTW